MTDIIITRAVALEQGLHTFFTGRLCRRGHKARKFVSNYGCVECQRLATHAQTERINARRRERYDNDAKLRQRKREEGRRYRSKNADQIRRRYLTEEHRAKCRDWKQRNSGYLSAKQKADRAADPEKYREKYRRWYATETGQAKAIETAHRRRARQLSADGQHTREDLRAILTAQDHRCTYCRADLRKVKRHLDHIQPLALGGSNGPENLQYLCAPCNLSKGAKDPLTFAQERGFLL